MAERIIMQHGKIRELAKHLNLHERTVALALKGLDETDTQKLIRKTALYKAWGGALVKK